MGARTRGLANNVLSSGKLDATDAISGTIAADNIANASLDNATTYGSVTGGVPQVAGDPPAPAEGDIWYNTNTGAIRLRSKANTWVTGGNMNTARNSFNGGAGTQTAALIAGGSGPPFSALTESYNGSAWTEVNDLNTARYGSLMRGVQTSALVAGGVNGNASPENPGFTRTGQTESWDGSSWTEVNDLNTARSDTGGAGTDNTSALCVAGKNPAANPPAGLLALTESWNGTSWTEVNDLNTASEQKTTVGTTTAALAFGGNPGPSNTAQTETWNGTSWTEVNDLNTARGFLGGSGTNTAALAFGGNIPPATASTESWDGTSWTEVNDLSTARFGLAGLGTNTLSLAAGGYSTTTVASTEEWDGVDTTFTVG